VNPWQTWLAGWAAMALIMTALWLVQRRTGKASIVDPVWALGVGGLSVFFAAMADGDPARRLLIAAMAGIWGLRLGGYLIRRVLRMTEDGRYETLREKWGSKAQAYLFLFFQVQAFWSVLFAAPMLIAARNSAPGLGWPDAAGAVFWLAAIAGETAADRQLQRFRSDAANRGKVCQSGLWRYSRHPNYFFEWLHWWAYVFIGWGAPYGWLTLLGPAAMLWFLFKITGIAPTEQQALASRGDAYRAYQRTTSVFFPWPPKQQEKAS